MTGPSVSVLIAVYNGERFLREAVESVLAQGHPALEVIVVDDGSTDGSAVVLEGLGGVQVLRQENAGQPAALNRGLDHATGEFLAFNDADDLWTPGRLAAQLAAFETEPLLEAVFGHVEQFAEADAPPGVVAGLTPDRVVQPSRLHTAMLIRRDAFDRIGPFAVAHRIAGVVEWADRARRAGLREQMLGEVVLRRRLHGANIGLHQQGAARADYLAMARAALARRRTQEGK
ncbi:MAG TPA: glycosyltransferase family A protein [Gemmatimonadales bacterium]|nr:glycosyltransferase family A protein [Gemmatimonadales bacterium]